jgi:hypothetical protein
MLLFLVEIFTPFQADIWAAGGQILQILLRKGLQNIHQRKEFYFCLLSGHVMHTATSIPYETNFREATTGEVRRRPFLGTSVNTRGSSIHVFSPEAVGY